MIRSRERKWNWRESAFLKVQIKENKLTLQTQDLETRTQVRRIRHTELDAAEERWQADQQLQLATDHARSLISQDSFPVRLRDLKTTGSESLLSVRSEQTQTEIDSLNAQASAKLAADRQLIEQMVASQMQEVETLQQEREIPTSASNELSGWSKSCRRDWNL